MHFVCSQSTLRYHSHLSDLSPSSDFPQKRLRPSSFWKRLPVDSQHARPLLANDHAMDWNLSPLRAPNDVRQPGLEGFKSERPKVGKLGYSDVVRAENPPTRPHANDAEPKNSGTTWPAERKGGTHPKPRSFHLLHSHRLSSGQCLRTLRETAGFPDSVGNQGSKNDDLRAQDATGKLQEVDGPIKMMPEQCSSQQKGPVRTPAEAERRVLSQCKAKQFGSHVVDTDGLHARNLPGEWDQSEALAAHLQQIAEEEMSSHVSRDSVSPSANLKFKPRPSKPRGERETTLAAAVSDTLTLEREGNHDRDEDFIYDIFVKDNKGFSGEADQLMSPSIDSVGIIVVDDGEEMLWDEFSETQDSDSQWDSEGDDENGKHER